jgi:Putative DNA-binding domain
MREAPLSPQNQDLRTRQQAWLHALISPEQAPLGGQELRQWSGGVREVDHALAVYINNIRANVLGALSKTYPVTQIWAGKSRFQRAVITGLRTHPPRSADLADYGACLPEALAAFAADDEQAHSWRALAELEWHLDQDRSLAQQTPWTLQAAAAALADDANALKVTLCTPFHLLTLPWDAWQALQTHQAQLQGHLLVLDEPAHPTQVHVLQQGTRVLVLSAAAWHWLSALAETENLEIATQNALAQYPDLPLAALLQTLLAHEVLALQS